RSLQIVERRIDHWCRSGKVDFEQGRSHSGPGLKHGQRNVHAVILVGAGLQRARFAERKWLVSKIECEIPAKLQARSGIGPDQGLVLRARPCGHQPPAVQLLHLLHVGPGDHHSIAIGAMRNDVCERDNQRSRRQRVLGSGDLILGKRLAGRGGDGYICAIGTELAIELVFQSAVEGQSCSDDCSGNCERDQRDQRAATARGKSAPEKMQEHRVVATQASPRSTSPRSTMTGFNLSARRMAAALPPIVTNQARNSTIGSSTGETLIRELNTAEPMLRAMMSPRRKPIRPAATANNEASPTKSAAMELAVAPNDFIRPTS